jgi:hypothetical protein
MRDGSKSKQLNFYGSCSKWRNLSEVSCMQTHTATIRSPMKKMERERERERRGRVGERQ